VVYDYCWLPHMSSYDPASCLFATTSRDNPIHLWDAYNGELRASYNAMNHLDELTHAISLAFTSDSQRILAGFKQTIRIFDVSRPGTSCQTITTLKKKKKGRKRVKLGQRGLMSCLASCPTEPELLAAGSYGGGVGLYSTNESDCLLQLQGDANGVTQVMFGRDGNTLFAGGRKDNDIICWDFRHTAQPLARMHRACDTNQRIQFDIDCSGRFLATGGTDGMVRFYDLTCPPDPDNWQLPETTAIKACDECVNGVAFHPSFSMSSPLVVTGSGNRVFAVPSLWKGGCDENDNDEADLPETQQTRTSNSLAMWRLDVRGYE